jgi:hypothetical protein
MDLHPIVGLVVGHGAFNLRGPVAESSDPCCQGQDPGHHSPEARGAMGSAAHHRTGRVHYSLIHMVHTDVRSESILQMLKKNFGIFSL